MSVTKIPLWLTVLPCKPFLSLYPCRENQYSGHQENRLIPKNSCHWQKLLADSTPHPPLLQLYKMEWGQMKWDHTVHPLLICKSCSCANFRGETLECYWIYGIFSSSSSLQLWGRLVVFCALWISACSLVPAGCLLTGVSSELPLILLFCCQELFSAGLKY